MTAQEPDSAIPTQIRPPPHKCPPHLHRQGCLWNLGRLDKGLALSLLVPACASCTLHSHSQHIQHVCGPRQGAHQRDGSMEFCRTYVRSKNRKMLLIMICRSEETVKTASTRLSWFKSAPTNAFLLVFSPVASDAVPLQK